MEKNEFINKLKRVQKAPFLFLGSGFSRRYLGTPTWSDLLQHFTDKPINQYRSVLATDSLPRVASEIAKENTNSFWELPLSDKFREKNVTLVTDQSMVLKLRIRDYLMNLSLKDFPEEYKDEISSLQKLNIDGIITTNWDDSAERIFPDFKSYIGQKELISSSTFNMAEIYKIHGCITKPSSMVLTEEDYRDFNERNVYLAAKLITIFIEHPIIFIGYSISDPNITDLLQSIVKCLDKENATKLQDNLVFVDWDPKEDATFCIDRTDILMEGGIMLPVTRIKTHDFSDVYDCLSYYERSIPANLLREYKKHFYEIVVSEKPERQLHVLNDRQVDSDKDIQVVYGFGAIHNYLSASGYTGLTANDLLKDVLDERVNYESEKVLTRSFPVIKKNSRKAFVPMYKYLADVGLSNDELYNQNRLGINDVLRKVEDFRSYRFSDEDKRKSLEEVIQCYTGQQVWKAIALIPYLDIKDAELPRLATFLLSNFNSFLIASNGHSTFMRKAICFYDWRRYGW